MKHMSYIRTKTNPQYFQLIREDKKYRRQVQWHSLVSLIGLKVLPAHISHSPTIRVGWHQHRRVSVDIQSQHERQSITTNKSIINVPTVTWSMAPTSEVLTVVTCYCFINRIIRLPVYKKRPCWQLEIGVLLNNLSTETPVRGLLLLYVWMHDTLSSRLFFEHAVRQPTSR